MRDNNTIAHPASRSTREHAAMFIPKQNLSRKAFFQRGSPLMTLTLPVWGFIQSIFSGISQVKRMVRKEDWTKIMFVYLCLFHVAPGQLCGPSPLAGLERMAEVLGKDLNQLLETLQTQNYPAYQRLESHWRHYMDCIAMVDTGYFK